MNHEYRLADIGEGLEEAEIVGWLVEVGQRVERDQPLIEVMTDKSNAELPSPVSGIVVGLHGSIGDIVHVGGLLATIDDAQAQAPTPAKPAPERASAPAATATASPAASPVASVASVAPTPQPTPQPSNGRVRPKASPSTRRAASERGIDLGTITGSGPGGRILLADLDAPAPATTQAVTEPAKAPVSAPAAPTNEAPTPPVAGEAPTAPTRTAATGSVPLTGVRRAVAENMSKSWAEIPHIHAFQHVDAEPLIEMRRRLKETSKTEYEHLTPMAFFVAAVARALDAFPDANASIDMQAGTIARHPNVHVGVAVAAERGLVVPVLKDAGSLDFPALTQALSQLVTDARAGSLPPSTYRGGTVTITNFGSLGGEQAVPIIRAPESMIFGFGSIAQRPFVVDDEVVARDTLNLVAGADHRLLDGDVTTSVLNHVATSLTDPLRLVL